MLADVFRRSRKGITPVIAIVLLILVTIGAVGVVYEQFNSLVGNPVKALEDQERIRNADYTIVAVVSTDPSDPASGAMNITIKNTGNALWNLSEHMELNIGPDGNSPSSISAFSGTKYDHPLPTNCENPNRIGNEGLLPIDRAYTCGTGLKFPATSWDNTVIRLDIKGVNKATRSCMVRNRKLFTC